VNVGRNYNGPKVAKFLVAPDRTTLRPRRGCWAIGNRRDAREGQVRVVTDGRSRTGRSPEPGTGFGALNRPGNFYRAAVSKPVTSSEPVTTPGSSGELINCQATMTWSASNALGFSFVSDPSPTTSAFAQLGRVKNGVFA